MLCRGRIAFLLVLTAAACAAPGGWTQEKVDATNKLWISSIEHTGQGQLTQARSDLNDAIALLKPGTEEYYGHWQGFLSYSVYKDMAGITYLAEDNPLAARQVFFDSVHAMQDGQQRVNQFLQRQHENVEMAMFFVTTLSATAIAAARPAAFRANPAAFQNLIHMPDFSAVSDKTFVTAASIDDDGIRMPIVNRLGFLHMVGRLVTPDGWCTATMVGSRLIATAAHCVTDDRGAPKRGAIFFRLTRYDHPTGEVIKQDIKLTQIFTHRKDAGWDRRQETDWAAGVLEEKPAQNMAYGYLGYVTEESDAADRIKKSKIAVAGYSSDLNEGDFLTLDWGCAAAGIKNGLLSERCAAWKGASGGPVILIDTVKETHGLGGILIAVHAYGGRPNGHRQNDLGILTSQFGKLLDELRRSYGDEVVKVSLR